MKKKRVVDAATRENADALCFILCIPLLAFCAAFIIAALPGVHVERVNDAYIPSFYRVQGICRTRLRDGGKGSLDCLRAPTAFRESLRKH